MKRWQAILLNVGLAAGVVAAQKIPDTATRDIVSGTLIALGAPTIANKASKSNPDGTPAQTAWQPEK